MTQAQLQQAVQLAKNIEAAKTHRDKMKIIMADGQAGHRLHFSSKRSMTEGHDLVSDFLPIPITDFTEAYFKRMDEYISDQQKALDAI